MIIPLGTNDWESAAENIRRLRLHNMYLAESPSSPDGVSRVSRPTLADYATIGEGPINGIWRQDSTLDGDWLVVSGDELYRFNNETKEAALLGDVPGPGYCQFAGTSDRVIVVRDGTAYSTDGETVTIVLMPDDVPGYEDMDAPVGSVAVINSFFLLSVEKSQRFYWISPGETNPDPLDFASAERIPDDIVSINVIGDEIWFVGESGPEVWVSVVDPDLPFQRVNGRVYSSGCASRNTAISLVYNNLPAAIWVTESRSVVVAQGQVAKISTESVDELLKTATNLRAWFFRHNRHDFYALTSNENTLVFDLTRGEWSRWDTYGQDNWLAHLGLQVGPVPYAVDYTSNKVWRLEEGHSDAGLPVIREVSGEVQNSGKPQKCSSVYVRVNTGFSPDYDLEPSLELRWSDDQGSTWSKYSTQSLGAKGEYSTDPIYRSLGLISRPGRVFEFRFTAPARFRLDYAVLNEDI